MSDKFDTDAILAHTNLVELVSRYVELKPRGPEFIASCPLGTHEDKNPSFTVYESSDGWRTKCFACGEFHNAISFLQAVESISFVDACKKLTNGDATGLPNPKPIPKRVLKKPPERRTFAPPPEALPPEFSIKGLGGAPSHTWTYRTAQGAVIGYICRYDAPTGKEIRCWSWGNRTDAEPLAWACGHFAKPRPLYNLDRIAADPAAQIIVVEGEKTADAATRLFRQMVATTWPGGANAHYYADWQPLAGRDVILIPDADEPGRLAMGKLAAFLAPIVKRVRVIEVQTYEQDGATLDCPKGWDLADMPDWTPADAMAWAKARLPKPGENAPELDLPHETAPDDATVAETPENALKPAPRKSTWAEKKGMAVNKDGDPLMNLDNVIRVIETSDELTGKIWYDEFLDAIITNWQGPLRQWTDADDLLLQLFMQRYAGLVRISAITCHDAAMMAANRNPKNECKDWITGLQWDGVPRLEHMLTDGFGAEFNDYTRSVGRCWIMSVVARVMEPGCKVDTVPVLEGSQGIGKSTALSILGGKWFIESHESVMSKDFFGVLNGHMLVEISEMHSFTRAEVERIKGVISCQVDRYRKAYGRNTEDHPRHTVLVCTTNRDDWQRDETGARRFWPVKCGSVNLDYIRENRSNLFAEAYALYKNGGVWWDVPTELQVAEVEQRREIDTWEPAIQSYLLGKTSAQMSDLLQDCIEIELAKQDVMAQRRVGRILRAIGWTCRVLRDGGKNRRLWVSPEYRQQND